MKISKSGMEQIKKVAEQVYVDKELMAKLKSIEQKDENVDKIRVMLILNMKPGSDAALECLREDGEIPNNCNLETSDMLVMEVAKIILDENG